MADPSFKHRLREGYHGESLKYCYQCGACTATCPISKLIGVYRPNQILELAKLGVRDMPQSSAFLFCSACTLCTKGCPQGVRVHEIMQVLKDLCMDDADVRAFVSGNFEHILEALGQEMPLPVTYGWICLRPGEEESVSDGVGSLTRSALLRALDRPRPEAAVPQADAKKVAVIGSGPAGLTAAWELRRAGFAVTLFESLAEPGGMLRTGIPSYRLPKHIVDAEVEGVKAAGVQLRTGVPVSRAFFDELVQGKEYAAVFVAAGATASRRLRLPGEELKGVVSALDLLREYNLTGKAKVGKKVVVIGGGNVATDAAGVALRSGAESVRLFCLEDREGMPAHEWEIKEIAAEGVELNPSWGPKAIMGDGEKVTAVEFVRCKSVLDADGKFNPVYDEKKAQTIEADTVVSAIGQSPDLSFLGESIGVFRGAVQVNPYTMETSLPGVFAGGDVVAGTASLIEAVATGKTAAESIKAYLHGEDS